VNEACSLDINSSRDNECRTRPVLAVIEVLLDQIVANSERNVSLMRKRVLEPSPRHSRRQMLGSVVGRRDSIR
jgi:hypothetical protein